MYLFFNCPSLGNHKWKNKQWTLNVLVLLSGYTFSRSIANCVTLSPSVGTEEQRHLWECQVYTTGELLDWS